MPKGGANPNMTKFPRIADYLQAKHTEVWEIINDAGMLGSLSPRRGGAVTFLLPDDATLKKYQKILVSANPEEVTDWIGTLILDKLIEKASDFEGAVNLNRKKIPADKSGIAGVKVAHDAGFKPFDRSGQAERKNMAVWKITGEYKSAEGSGARRRRRAKKGGEEEPKPVLGAMEVAELSVFVNAVFNAERAALQKALINNEPRNSPCMIAVRNILNKWDSESNPLLNCAYEIMSVDPILNFCLLFLNGHVFSCKDLYAVDYMAITSGNQQNYAYYIGKAIEHNKSNVSGHQGIAHYTNCDTDCKVNCPELKGIFSKHRGLRRYIDEFKFVMAHYLRAINDRAPNALALFDDMRKIVSANCGLWYIPSNFNSSSQFTTSKYCCHILTKDDADLTKYMGGDEDEEEDPDKEVEDSAKPNEVSEEHALPDDCVEALKKMHESAGSDDKFMEALHKILKTEEVEEEKKE